MKQRRLQTLCLPVVLAIAVLLSGCGEKESESHAGYDFQLNMAENTAYGFADTKDGFLFAKDYYLYHTDENMQPKPVCIRGGCLHDKDVDININCDAFIENAESMFYYDEHLYVLANNRKSVLCLTEYTTAGIFVRSVSVLPDSARNMIQHRGAFYYSFDSEGTAAVVKLKEADSKSSVIYRSRYSNGSLEPVLAYDKYVYIRETDLTGENPSCMLIYNTESNEVSVLESDKVIICDGMLLFDKNSDESDRVWTSKPNGEKQKETDFELKADSTLLCAFGEYIIEASSITEENKTQRFTVYKDDELFFEFTLENVEGRNWSTRPADGIIWTDEHIFILPQMKDGDHAIVEIDKAGFERGEFESRIIFEPRNY
ncbi:MAG: hypothetical protein IJ017_01360 [Oscillospiraceae bacterium]|nr:hypothetical protein [Oscillospiraceae bacterium]